MRKLGILLAVVLLGLMVFAQADLSSIVNRIELLEEYANMIYDAVGTKVATEDFEAYVAEMEDRIGALETELLNVKSSVETGMPALRDMLYELSANLASVEERLTSYVEVAIASLKEELGNPQVLSEATDLSQISEIYDSIEGLNEILTGLAAQIGDTDYLLRKQIADLEKNMNANFENYVAKSELEEKLSNLYSTIEDLKVTLDIHDSDILKIYETLGTLSEQIAILNDMLGGMDELVSNVESLMLKVDMHDQDIVNIYDNLSTKADIEQVDMLEEDLQTLTNRLELLEEYANMIYDTLNTKVSEEDFASAVEELNANIEKVNTGLNAKINKVSEDTNKKIEETNKKIDTVQLLSILGIGLGAVAIILKFVNF